MYRLPPRSTRTDTLFPYTTLFRSARAGIDRSHAGNVEAGVEAMKIEVDGDLIIREHGAAVILQRFARRVAPYFRCGLRQLLFQIRGTPARDFSRVPRLSGIDLRQVGGTSRSVDGGSMLLHKPA